MVSLERLDYRSRNLVSVLASIKDGVDTVTCGEVDGWGGTDVISQIYKHHLSPPPFNWQYKIVLASNIILHSKRMTR